MICDVAWLTSAPASNSTLHTPRNPFSVAATANSYHVVLLTTICSSMQEHLAHALIEIPSQWQQQQTVIMWCC